MADETKQDLSLEDANKAAVDAINADATKVILEKAGDKWTVTSSKPD